MEGAIKLLQRKITGAGYFALKGTNDFIGLNNNNTQLSESLTEDSIAFVWATLGSDVQFSAKALNNSDVGKTLTVEWLDRDFIRNKTTVTLPAVGQSVEITADKGFRVNKATLSAPATGTVSIWTPYMYGSQQDLYVIVSGNSTGNHGIFTVPKGETYALLGVDMLSQREDHAQLSVQTRTHDVTSGGARLQGTLGFNDVLYAACPVNEVFKATQLTVPYLLPEGTDIEMKGTKISNADQGYTSITATAHIARFE